MKATHREDPQVMSRTTVATLGSSNRETENPPFIHDFDFAIKPSFSLGMFGAFPLP